MIAAHQHRVIVFLKAPISASEVRTCIVVRCRDFRMLLSEARILRRVYFAKSCKILTNSEVFGRKRLLIVVDVRLVQDVLILGCLSVCQLFLKLAVFAGVHGRGPSVVLIFA